MAMAWFLLSLAVFIYGFLREMRDRFKRRRGSVIMAAGFAIFAFLASPALQLEQDADARQAGWKNHDEKSVATAAGFTDPGIYRQSQTKIASAAIAAIAAEKTAADELDVENRRKGFHCLSAWDGSSAELIAQVKAQLREPDSFEEIETKITPRDEDGMHKIGMTYRARNGYGGMNVETAMGTVVSGTCVTKLVTSE